MFTRQERERERERERENENQQHRRRKIRRKMEKTGKHLPSPRTNPA